MIYLNSIIINLKTKDMKKIFKFLPVALAAVALASCSSDDLTVTNAAGEIENVDGKLLVQVDGANEDVTRSGFITTINPASSLLRSSLFFSQGDKLKLYHEATSWKPEVWEAQSYGQYTNADGAAGGEVAVFDKTDATITEAEKAYGIFPATIGQFGNENRTSLKYDLSALKFIEYNAEAKDYNDGKVTVAATDDATGNTKAYTAPFPLWGVKNAGAKVMTVKHLAGILRLDLANVANSTMAANQARYIVIQSTNKLTGELATANDVFNPNATEKIDPDKLMTTAPKLVTEALTAPATALASVPTIAANITGEDIIVVKLTKDDPNHVMLFLPITAGNGETTPGTPDIMVYVSKPVLATNATINLTSTTNDLAVKADGTTPATYALDANLIEAENKAQMKGFNDLSATDKQKVQPGVFYRLNDDTSNQIENAWTPFELAREIIKKDKAAYRDFDVYVKNNIRVKNEDSAPQNFYLDLSGSVDNYGMNTELQNYELKHNVTVHVTLEDASTNPVTNISTLYVKTKGGKKLTLDITNGGNAVDSIVVKANDLKSELELQNTTAKLPAIHVYEGNNDKVTLKSSTTNLVVNSNVKVDNATATAIDEVVLAKGSTKLSLLAGEVTKISIADAGATDKYEPIAADYTIYTEGNASIKEVDYANMPFTTTSGKKTDTYNLVYTSKYIKGSSAPATATTTITGESDKYITSAAQLAALSSNDVTVLGTYDLDGSETNDWNGLTLTMKQIQGAQFFRYSNSSATTRAIEGNTTIKNLYSTTGLISTWTPSASGSISNITFDGGNKVIGATNGSELGLLAGNVYTTTADATIKNIVVKGTNEVTGSGTNGTAMKGYGAVIGKTSGSSELKIANVKVETGTKVKGYQYVGGIVGEVAGKIVFGMQSANGATDKFAGTATYAANDVANSSAATLETFMLGSAPYSIALPTTGSFFGGASTCANDGDIMILGELTALTTARSGEKWGYYVANGAEYFPWTIHLNYNEIGHCGTEVSGTAVIKSTTFKKIYMQTKTTGANPTYGIQTALVPYVGTQAAYNTAVGTAATYGIGKTMFFDFVKQP